MASVEGRFRDNGGYSREVEIFLYPATFRSIPRVGIGTGYKVYCKFVDLRQIVSVRC